jgi:hypothetical protein
MILIGLVTVHRLFSLSAAQLLFGGDDETESSARQHRYSPARIAAATVQGFSGALFVN